MSLSFCNQIPVKLPRGSTQKSFIRGRSHPRSNQLLDIIFDSKGTLSSFVRLLLANDSPWDANAEARQNDAFSPPPPFPHFPRCILVSTQSTLLGERVTAEIGSCSNIPKFFYEVEYELTEFSKVQ